jgi:hypothetical protein
VGSARDAGTNDPLGLRHDPIRRGLKPALTGAAGKPPTA